MSAIVCTSRWVCFLNGLRGTALFLAVAALAWSLVEGVPVWSVLPGLLVAGGAMVLRGNWATGLAFAACIWAAGVLSIWGPL